MFNKTPLSNSITYDGFRHRMILILICIMICLLYIHGEHYTQCTCIFPDEIHDLFCPMLSLLGNNTKDILFEYIYIKVFISVHRFFFDDYTISHLISEDVVFETGIKGGDVFIPQPVNTAFKIL